VQAPWLKDLTSKDHSILQSLELIMTWQEIIQYREWALIELRLEAKRFVDSGIEVKPHNLSFTDIWVKCVDAEEIKMKTRDKSEYVKLEDIELNFIEKTGLYEILATDQNKTLLSYMDGETMEKDSKQFSLKIDLSRLVILVTELGLENEPDRERDFISIQTHTHCDCNSCREKKAGSYFEGRQSEIYQPFTRSEEQSEPLEEYGGKGFESHMKDVMRDRQDRQKTSSTNLQSKQVIKEVRVVEPKIPESSLKLVGFIEFVDLYVNVSAKADKSLTSSEPITLKKLLVYDTSIIPELNFDFLKSNGDAGSPFIDQQRTTMSAKQRDDYSSSIILSLQFFSGLILYMMTEKNAFPSFFERVNCRNLLTFIDQYNKDYKKDGSDFKEIVNLSNYNKYFNIDNHQYFLHLKGNKNVRIEGKTRAEIIDILGKTYDEARKIFYYVYYPVFMKYYGASSLPIVLAGVSEEGSSNYMESDQIPDAPTYKFGNRSNSTSSIYRYFNFKDKLDAFIKGFQSIGPPKKQFSSKDDKIKSSSTFKDRPAVLTIEIELSSMEETLEIVKNKSSI
jgi:hypothetical protein